MKHLLWLLTFLQMSCDSKPRDTRPTITQNNTSVEGSVQKSVKFTEEYAFILDVEKPSNLREARFRELSKLDSEESLDFIIAHASISFPSKKQGISAGNFAEDYPAFEQLVARGHKATPKIIASLLDENHLPSRIVKSRALIMIEGRERSKALVLQALTGQEGDHSQILRFFE